MVWKYENGRGPQVTKRPGAYQGDIYMKGMEGVRPTVTTDSRFWEEEARKRLSANAYGYVAGNGEEYQNSTHRRS